MVIGLSHARCRRIFGALSGDERMALRTVANGKGHLLSVGILKMMKTRRLAAFDGRRWALTAAGRLIAFWYS